MYRKVQDFLDNWAYESSATAKVLGNLTDESLGQKVTDDGRSLGFLAWHTVVTIPDMMGRTGLKIDGPAFEDPMPSTAAEIKQAYEKAAASLADQISKEWNDDSLNTEDDMYGENWKKGQSLHNFLTHEIHHRAQMTVLMRQAGLKVPGVYGPSKEEWANYGMEPMP
ncbi:MAG: DinB family protein [Ignavibacteriae bacterium]|nr:DinB family protein [Ignavibacteriota bacterium]MCB9242700.1 DinB family protein [Ignavibacteriales bacterium]